MLSHAANGFKQIDIQSGFPPSFKGRNCRGLVSVFLQQRPLLKIRLLLKKIQSTLVISKSKGPSKTVRDIRTSTYQICSIEEKTI